MKPAPPPLRVGAPCPKRWDDMSGDAKRRFCEHCQLHVHNLSAMPRRERERFVAESAGRGCITYEVRPDGTMVTPSFWRGLRRPLERWQLAAMATLAALVPFLFSACASRRQPNTLGRVSPLSHTSTLLGDISVAPGEKAPDCTRTTGTPLPPR